MRRAVRCGRGLGRRRLGAAGALFLRALVLDTLVVDALVLSSLVLRALIPGALTLSVRSLRAELLNARRLRILCPTRRRLALGVPALPGGVRRGLRRRSGRSLLPRGHLGLRLGPSGGQRRRRLAARRRRGRCAAAPVLGERAPRLTPGLVGARIRQRHRPRRRIRARVSRGIALGRPLLAGRLPARRFLTRRLLRRTRPGGAGGRNGPVRRLGRRGLPGRLLSAAIPGRRVRAGNLGVRTLRASSLPARTPRAGVLRAEGLRSGGLRARRPGTRRLRAGLLRALLLRALRTAWSLRPLGRGLAGVLREERRHGGRRRGLGPRGLRRRLHGVVEVEVEAPAGAARGRRDVLVPDRRLGAEAAEEVVLAVLLGVSCADVPRVRAAPARTSGNRVALVRRDGRGLFAQPRPALAAEALRRVRDRSALGTSRHAHHSLAATDPLEAGRLRQIYLPDGAFACAHAKVRRRIGANPHVRSLP
ncbi:Basic proline-rich protein precursor [Gulosibacter sp. 10]|nr:Basic proline-rich protein precursor [Gulosibacter sp. 10]